MDERGGKPLEPSAEELQQLRDMEKLLLVYTRERGRGDSKDEDQLVAELLLKIPDQPFSQRLESGLRVSGISLTIALLSYLGYLFQLLPELRWMLIGPLLLYLAVLYFGWRDTMRILRFVREELPRTGLLSRFSAEPGFVRIIFEHVPAIFRWPWMELRSIDFNRLALILAYNFDWFSRPPRRLVRWEWPLITLTLLHAAMLIPALSSAFDRIEMAKPHTDTVELGMVVLLLLLFPGLIALALAKLRVKLLLDSLRHLIRARYHIVMPE